MADKPFVTPRRLKRFLTNLRGEKLNTKEEILANTDAKKFAGAMAVQEMFNDVIDSLGGFEFYTDEQGKAYYKPMGADSGIPFSSGELRTETITINEYAGGEKIFTLNFSSENIEAIFIEDASADGRSLFCRTLYVKKLSPYQFMSSANYSELVVMGEIATNYYWYTYVASMNGSSITIYRGAAYTGVEVTINVTVLYK